MVFCSLSYFLFYSHNCNPACADFYLATLSSSPLSSKLEGYFFFNLFSLIWNSGENSAALGMHHLITQGRLSQKTTFSKISTGQPLPRWHLTRQFEWHKNFENRLIFRGRASRLKFEYCAILRLAATPRTDARGGPLWPVAEVEKSKCSWVVDTLTVVTAPKGLLVLLRRSLKKL